MLVWLLKGLHSVMLSETLKYSLNFAAITDKGPTELYCTQIHYCEINWYRIKGVWVWVGRGFTPSRHLMLSSGREHTTHRIFYMPSRTGTAGHNRAFDNPVTEHWGKAEMFSLCGTRTDNISGQSWTRYLERANWAHPSSPQNQWTTA